MLLVVAVVAALLAVSQRNSALEQLRASTARAIAAESVNLSVREPGRAARLALLAYQTEPSAQATAALMAAYDNARHVTGYLAEHGAAPADPDGLVTKVALSSDGRTVAGVSRYDGSVRLWDAASRAEIGRLRPPHRGEGNVSPSLTFTDNGRLAVMFSGIVDVWDIQSRTLIYSRSLAAAGRFEAVARDGESAVVSVGDGGSESTYVLPLRPGTSAVLVGTGPAALAAATFRATGRYTTPVLFPKEPRDFVDVSEDGATAVRIRNFRNLEVWDVRSGSLVASVELPGEPGWLAVAISDDGTSVLVGNDVGEVVRFVRSTGVFVEVARLPTAVYGLDLVRGGRTGAGVDALGAVTLLSPADDHRYEEIPTNLYGEVFRLQTSPDGRYMTTERNEATDLWEVATARRIASFPGPATWNAEITPAEFAADGSKFLTPEDGRIVVRRLPDGIQVGAAPAAVGPVEVARTLHTTLGGPRAVVDYTVQPRRVVVVGDSGEHVLADAPAGLESSVDVVANAAFAVVQISGPGGSTVRAYDLRDGNPRPIGTEAPETRDLAGAFRAVVDDEGHRVLLADAILDISSGSRVPLSGGDGLISGSSSVFVADGSQAVRQVEPTRDATAEIRSRLLVWDTREGRLLGEWRDPENAATPNDVEAGLVRIGDDRVAAQRADGLTRVWNVAPNLWAARLCTLVGDLPPQERAGYLGEVDDPRGCFG
ncbi:WD40 repeat domain-containing protein [Pseudonocardia yuanmonensis]|uniref:WD40 repeat domain-containing protein n=1 Tax=Pseudonocardia yuanmonensis TaxID=1095914 RepID=UPI0031EC8312